MCLRVGSSEEGDRIFGGVNKDCGWDILLLEGWFWCVM